MSSDEPMLTWETARTAQRKRAALGLAALAVAALVVVGGMLLLFNHSADNGTPVAGPSASVSLATSTDATTRKPTPRPRTSTGVASSTTAKTPSPSNVVLTCSATPACVLPGDPGGVLTAINAYRSSHGLKAIPGSVTPAAQTCAVNNGDGLACPQSYFWEPVSGHDGKQVVSKIAAKGNGSQFLLDPQVKSVQIGWAYIPSSGGYECAVINVY